jgi:uncharacterized protein YbjT (DUF2867 family)
MILTVGATGHLGGAIVDELCRRGKPVRCLVRKDADISKLTAAGVEIVYGDVRDRESLSQAVQGVQAIISTFSTRILKERRVSALWENDYEGNLSLIKRAQAAGVKNFIFTSYWGLAKFGNFEHGRIKKLVEDLLTVSGVDYTVFRITTLATDLSILLGNRLQRKGWAPMFMKREEKVRPILPEDLAWCIADALDNPKAARRIIEVAGEEEYTFLELQHLFSRCLGRNVSFVFIPPGVARLLASCIDFVTNDVYNAKGLVSAFTGGSTCDIKEMHQIFAIRQGSFARHLEDYLKTGNIITQPPQTP